jgi:predicted ATPase/DNA-binding SARP family transcriptional activator
VSPVRVHDLGPLSISTGAGPQPLRGSKAAALLALLTVHVNRRVSVEALMDAAWGDRVSAGSASTLESHIWRLRHLLEPDRSAGESPTVLINDAGGYRLIGTAYTVDSLAFEHLGGEVRDLVPGGRASMAVDRADEALALWRGRPYGRFADEDFARPAVARLDELRQQVCEWRIDALMAMGAVDTVLVDLEQLIVDNPYRERLWEARMLALYRSGRVEESLQAFQRVRSLLIDEIGSEPGAQLQDLHHRILNADSGLLQGDSSTRPSRRAPVEVHLPVYLSPTVGRENDLARLVPLVASERLVSIVGTAGCGKTRLAVETAKAVADDFPDGVWFVDLSEIGDADLVTDAVASAIGFASSPAASPLDALRNYLSDRRLLVVLDNCEHVVDGVRHVVETTLGAVPGRCAFLLTSREPLDVDGETVWTLGPLSLLPGTDTKAPAVELFLQRLRSAAPRITVDDEVVRRAITVSVAVDGLPLALELAAARARTYTLADIVTQVTDDPSALRRIGRGPADHRATVRSAVDWSFRMLGPAEQRAHRRLSVLPGSFTLEVADAVVDGGDVGSVADVLEQLVHRSMLSSTGPTRIDGATTFGQLATVRAHGHHALVDAGEFGETTARRDRWSAATLEHRPRLGTVGEAAWLRTIDDGYPTIRATLAQSLLDAPDPEGVRLPVRLLRYWYYRAQMVEAGRWLQLAHDAAVDPIDETLTALALATALTLQGRSDLAHPAIEVALPRLPSLPVDQLAEVGEMLVGVATAAWARDEFDLLRRAHRHLVTVVESVGDGQLSVLCDAVGCVARAASGDLGAAAVDGAEVYERATAAGNGMAAWIAAGPPMVEALLAQRPVDGVPWVLRVMEGHLRVGSRAGGMFIETRANFATQSGDYVRAATLYSAARSQTRRAAMVWPRRELTLKLLEVTREQLTDDDFERAWQDGERQTLQDVVDAG